MNLQDSEGGGRCIRGQAIAVTEREATRVDEGEDISRRTIGDDLPVQSAGRLAGGVKLEIPLINAALHEGIRRVRDVHDKGMIGLGAVDTELDLVNAGLGNGEGGAVGGPAVAAARVCPIAREHQRAAVGGRRQSRSERVNEAVDGQTAILAIHTVGAIETIYAVRSVDAIKPIRAVDTVEPIGAIDSVNAIQAVSAVQAVQAVRSIAAINAVEAIGPVDPVHAVRAIETIKSIGAIETGQTLRALFALQSLKPLESRQTLQALRALNALQPLIALRPLNALIPLRSLRARRAGRTLSSEADRDGGATGKNQVVNAAGKIGG